MLSFACSLKSLNYAIYSFIAGTSSRSTKLIWGGSRYLVQALVSLFNFDLRLIRSPRHTIHKFTEEFRMVMNCHRERKFLLDTQPHLTNWLPIAVPLKTWIMWPPPFGYPPAALGALGLFPLFFKFVSTMRSIIPMNDFFFSLILFSPGSLAVRRSEWIYLSSLPHHDTLEGKTQVPSASQL
jgi:hypothetical protein